MESSYTLVSAIALGMTVKHTQGLGFVRDILCLLGLKKARMSTYCQA